jgi:hypothetical protein
MSSQNQIGLALAAAVILSVGAIVFGRDTSAAAHDQAADVNVSCGYSQRAVVRQSVADGRPEVNILCLDAAEGQMASHAIDNAGRLMPASYAVAPAMERAMSYARAPVAIEAPAPVVRTQPASSATPQRSRPASSSVQKRLLIIGGSSGAGAGIGALIGGKKGSLIGAVIGGGGAAIVDQLKHR